MCENCDEHVKIIENAITEFMNNEGEFSERLDEKMRHSIEKEGMDEEQAQRVRSGVRARVIAQMCAELASATQNSPYHHVPPSVVLGMWAGEILQEEMEQSLAVEMLQTLFSTVTEN
jgi:hypothetical protein